MDTKTLTWSQASTTPLVEQYVFADPTATALVVGTGLFRAGQRMPLEGSSSYGMREVSIILEGAVETTVGGKTVILRAGDIVTVPAGSQQMSHFIEDTKLVYLFFGSESDGE